MTDSYTALCAKLAAQPNAAESALACAHLVSGNTIFRLVPIGGRFQFPRSADVFTKTAAMRYRRADGRSFSTGRNVAVIAEESRR
jgi:hypothetical protein